MIWLSMFQFPYLLRYIILVLTTAFSLTRSNFKCISYTIFPKARHLIINLLNTCMSSPVTMLIYPSHHLHIIIIVLCWVQIKLLLLFIFIGDQPGYFHFGLLKQLALPLHHQPLHTKRNNILYK